MDWTMYQLIALDIDGTLLGPDGTIPPRVHKALAAARDRGVLLVLATGRRLRSTLPVVDQLGAIVPVVVQNGALVWDTARDTPVSMTPFDRANLERVVHEALERRIGLVLIRGPETGEPVVITTQPDDAWPQPDIISAFRSGRIERLSADELLALPDVYTIDLFGWNDRLLPLLHALRAAGFSVYSGALATDANLPATVANVHMPGVSKAAGVAALARQHGLTLEHVLAVGDGDNDLPLIAAAGLGIAMGHAPSHVREQAKLVVSAPDGVAEAIERFILEPRQPPVLYPTAER